MKTSTVLASVLFGSFAAAAPFDKRDLVTTTQIVTETVMVYTTVYDYEEGPAPTSSQGLFYEQPAQPTSVAAVSTSVAAVPTSVAAPAYTPPAPVEPSMAYTPAPQAPAPTPEAPKEEPKPSSAAYVAPAPAAPTPTPAAPAPAPATPSQPPATTNHQTTGDQYTGVDITIYNGNGDLGACGKKIIDTELVAAVGQGVWGKSTYDVMTGEATNPMCGQKIEVSYNGRTVQATVLDLCPGCLGPNDVDLTMAAFKVVTGSEEITRYHGASWSKVA